MLDRNAIADIMPLTPMQSGLLFHTLQQSSQYVELLEYAGTGAMDVAMFTQAWNMLVERHEMLRTVYFTEPKLMQVLLKAVPSPVHVYDHTADGLLDAHAFVHGRKQAIVEAGLPLAPVPPFRIELILTGADTWTMLLVFHHVVMDGWCQNILLSEFVQIFSALRRGQQPSLPPAPQFRSFIRWLKGSDPSASVEHWKRSLAGVAATRRTLPAPAVAASVATDSIHVELDTELCSRLEALQHGHHGTAADMAHCIWALALAIVLDDDTVVTGTTVSGRPASLPGADMIVGCFINMVPTVAQVHDGATLAEILDTCIRDGRGRIGNDLAPLADVQSGTSLAVTPIDNILVIENYPFDKHAEREIQRTCGFRFAQVAVHETTNYALTVQVNPQRRWHWNVQYRTDLVDATLAQTIAALLPSVAAALTDTPHATLSYVRAHMHIPAMLPLRVRCELAASFSTNMLVPAIGWWGNRIGMPVAVEAAAYGHVQEVLQDTRTAVPLVVMQRFEDWFRYAHDEDTVTDMNERFLALCDALVQASARRNLVVVIPPVPAAMPQAAELHERWLQMLRTQSQIRMVRADDAMQVWNVQEMYDPIADAEAHLPYTEEASMALAAAMVRAVRSMVRAPRKVIVVDCDNTLWQGVVGEDGVDGLTLAAEHLLLQQWLVERSAEGTVIALCSKNEEADVWAAFAGVPGMILQPAHITEHAINWQPKSANIRLMAERLNLGLDSFLFLDDSTMECSDVMRHCPQVLTLRVPEDAKAIPALLGRLWCCDVWSVTAEDRERNAMYASEAQRKREEGSAVDRMAFLRDLDLRLELAPITATSIERASQLTQRTNQFNINTRRRSVQDIERSCELPGTVTVCARLRDRYGKYGIVGIAIMQCADGIATLDTLLMSCRALGRGVEYVIMAHLAAEAAKQGCSTMYAGYIPTPRNAQIVPYLESCSFMGNTVANGEIAYTASTGTVPPAPEHVSVTVLDSLPPDTSAGTSPVHANAVQAGGTNVESSRGNGIAWQIDTLLQELHASHRYDIAPMTIASLKDVVATATMQPGPADRAAYVAPATEAEHAVVDAVQALLNMEQVGIDDDFFALGGHSITAVHLVSRIAGSLKTRITITDVFSERTIRKIAAVAAAALAAGKTGRASADIPRVEDRPSYRLAPAQERIWMMSELHPDIDYSVSGVMKVQEHLDHRLLRTALEMVAARHDALHAKIDSVHDEAHMVFDAGMLPEIVICEENEIDERMGKPFDLRNGPLVRCVVVPLERSTILGLAVHHIVTDGWSLGVLRDELLATYRRLQAGDAQATAVPAVRYRDYAVWMQERLQGDTGRTLERYWEETLADSPDLFLFPTVADRNSAALHEGATLHLDVVHALTADMQAVAQATQATAFHVWMSAYRIVLDAFAADNDMIVGTVTSGRDHPALMDVVGMMVNTVPIRTRLDDAMSVRQFVQHVALATTRAMEHSALPFERIVRAAGVPSGTEANPLFETMLIYQSATDTDGDDVLSKASVLQEESGAGRFDISVSVLPSGSATRLRIEYRSALFTHEAMQRLARRIVQVAGSLKSQLDRPVRDLDILLPEETEHLERISHGGIAQHPLAPTLPDAVRKVAALHPDTTAIGDGNEEWTYEELQARVDAVRGQIERMGLHGSEACIGIAIPRSAVCVATLLGVMSAGCTAVMLDPHAPQARLVEQLRITETKAVLTTEGHADAVSLAATAGTRVLVADTHGMAATAQPHTGQTIAYVIFTSGSSGTPKAVMGTHEGLMQTLTYQAMEFGCGHGVRALAMASPTFDAYLSEVGTALISGATLVCAPRRIVEDADLFRAFLQEQDIAVATIPPAYMRQLGSSRVPSLNVLVTAGEAADGALLEHHAHGRRVINAYGPTECSICVTMHTITGTMPHVVPIGTPLPGVEVFVADRHGRRAPYDAEGVLCIAGGGVALGYLSDPERTAAAFLRHPDGSGRMYVTNDLVRYDASGDLVFVGRRDAQVKINGIRIELGEVEAHLRAIGGVRDAVVVRHRDREALLAVVTGDVTEPQLRTSLERILPQSMIPARIVVADSIPLTPHGKVDRTRIYDIATTATEHTGMALTDSERAMAEHWLAVLGRTPAHADADFFALGGNSLSVITLMQRLRHDGYRVETQSIYRASSLRAMASLVQRPTDRQGPDGAYAGPLPLLPAAAWFFGAIPFDDAHAFTMNSVRSVDTMISGDDIQRVATQLMHRHTALRLRYVRGNDGHVTAEVLAPSDVRMSVTEHNVDAITQDVLDDIADAAASGIRLDQAPLCCLALVASPDGCSLVAIVHHAIADAVSMQVLESDLERLLRGDVPVVSDDLVAAARAIGVATVRSATVRTPLPDPVRWTHEVDADTVERIRRTGYQPDIVLAIAAGLCLRQNAPHVALIGERTGRDYLPHDSQNAVGWFTAFHTIHTNGYMLATENVRSLLQREARSSGTGTDSLGICVNVVPSEAVQAATVGHERNAITAMLHAMEIDCHATRNGLHMRCAADASVIAAESIACMRTDFSAALECVVDIATAHPRPIVMLFPPVGGEHAVYRTLVEDIGDAADIVYARYPGHDATEEIALDTVESIATVMVERLHHSTLRPTVFVGHSLGGAVAFETARRIGAGMQLKGVVISSYPNPAVTGSRMPTVMDDTLDLPEVLRQVVVAGLHAGDTYTGPSGTLAIPVAVVSADAEGIPSEHMNGWSVAASEGFAATRTTGGHDHILVDPSPVVLHIRTLHGLPDTAPTDESAL